MQGYEIESATVGAMYWVPLDEFHDPHRVRQHFSAEKKSLNFQTKRWESTYIPLYREGVGEFAGCLGLPIAEGMEMFPANITHEALSDGRDVTSWTRTPDPHHPMAAPGQDKFMEATHDAVTGFYSSLIKAETGTGKTVVSLAEAQKLGGTVCIMVPTHRLMNQWTRQAHELLGVPMDKIGHIIGPKCQWGRDVVIAMMKSVAMRDYPPECYTAFRTLITDEVHNTGATLNSQIQGLFNARFKWSVTATDEKRDGGDRVYYSFYGKPSFKVSMQGVPTELLTLYFTSSKPISGNGKTAKLIALAYDHERNEIFARVAKHWHRTDKPSLFITEHVRHAEIMRKLFIKRGIPENDIGMYLGSQSVDGISSDTTPEYLDWVEKRAKVVIATYGMMKEGIDIPRLSRGMDMSPRDELEQVLGRIRRRWDGKDKAIWVTLRDRAVPSFDQSYVKRIRSVKHLTGVEQRRVGMDDVLRHT